MFGANTSVPIVTPMSYQSGFQTEALYIVCEMSILYGAQCSLYKLDAIRPLLSILLLKKNNVAVRYMAAETLGNVAKLRKARKLIRIHGGVWIMVGAKAAGSAQK